MGRITTGSTARLHPEHTTWRCATTMRFDHTIVPAPDTGGADLFGVTITPGPGPCAEDPNGHLLAGMTMPETGSDTGTA
jgi:hypothetical protein